METQSMAQTGCGVEALVEGESQAHHTSKKKKLQLVRLFFRGRGLSDVSQV